MTQPDLNAVTARLRAKQPNGFIDNYGIPSKGWVLNNPDGPEAADTIESQQARIAELEAENRRLRQALSGSYVVGNVIRSDDRGGPPVVKLEPKDSANV